MELLSPAGSPEALRAAVLCGADAVYLGMTSFSARAGAKNFETDELLEAIAFAHLYGVKVYITLNTLTTDREAERFLESVKTACDLGADAIIVQDTGMARLIRESAPDMPIHASTQMSIHSLDGVRAAADMGISRVILARELDKNNLLYIARNSPIELEVFIHGALCVSHSGQCLLSSMIASRSGNRGRCAQPCRLLYSYGSSKPFPMMSLKDLSLAEHINELKGMGIASLKIEGRLKRPEYVALVSSAYKRLITTGQPPSKEDMARLELMFSRDGFTDGYYTRYLGSQMFGVHNDYSESREYIELCKEMRGLYAPGKEFSRIPVKAAFRAVPQSHSLMAATDDKGNIARALGPVPEPAITRELTEDIVKAQIEKTANTAYYIKAAEVDIEKGLSMPLSAINAMRRDMLSSLDTMRTLPQKRTFMKQGLIGKPERITTNPGITIGVEDPNMLPDNILDSHVDYIYVPLERINDRLDTIAVLCLSKQNLALKLPRVYFDSEKPDIINMLDTAKGVGVKTVLCTNIGQIAPSLNMGFDVRCDFSLNVMNSYTLDALSAMGVRGVTLSYELMLAQIRDMVKPIDTELLVYGRQELMLLENCIIEGSYPKCEKCADGQFITDRRGEKFLVRAEFSCRNTILNGHVLYLLDKLYEYGRLGITHLRMNFTDEDKDTSAKLFERALRASKTKPREFTRGLYYKGVK